VNGAITYINTDLDLKSADDLAPLVAAFQAANVFALHVTLGDDGVWVAALETETQYDEPEPNIAALVAVAEALPDELRSAWARCTLRELNIGYDCGAHPWGFTQALAPELLRRVAALGASVRITLYPDREPVGAPQP
jgi:hypothetical protein